MVAEVLLEVEDAELVRLLDAEKLAESRIGLDVLLVHQIVVLGILADTSRDLGARNLRALGEAEERRKSIGNLRRDGEDGGLLHDRLTRRRGGLRAAAAATLLGLLELTRNLLLELLHRREDGRESRAGRVDLLDEGVELGDNVDVLLGGGDNSRNNSRSRGGDMGNRGRRGGENRRRRSRGCGGGGGCGRGRLGSLGRGLLNRC